MSVDFFYFHSCIKYVMLYKFPGIFLCLNKVSLKINIWPEIFYQKMMETGRNRAMEKPSSMKCVQVVKN